MSLTIQIKGNAATSITLDCKEVSEDMTSSKMKVSAGSGQPYYVKFGYEKSISITGSVHSQTDHDKLVTWDGDEILECTSSSYPEISTTVDPNNYLIVDKFKLSRKGGYLNRWDFSITLIQDSLSKLLRWS